MPGDLPASKHDLVVLKQELKQDLTSMEDRFKQDLTAMEDRLVEKMRDRQTELPRGVHRRADHPLRKVEADQSNLDASLSGRVNVLGRRLLEIEIGRAHV